MKKKFESAQMTVFSGEQDILTVSPAGANTDPDWGNLDFGSEKNSPLADLANTIADKL